MRPHRPADRTPVLFTGYGAVGDPYPTGMTGWRVQRSADNGATWDYGVTLPATDTSFTDDNDGTGLADLTTYWYRYRPIGPGVAAAYSVPVDATTGLAVAQDVAVTATGPHGVDVTWADDSQHETGYTVNVTNTDTNQTFTHDTLAANTTTTSFTNLPPGYYTTTVITKHGTTTTTSTQPLGVYTTDEAPTLTVDPQTKATSISPSTVHLSWTPNSTRVSRYSLEYRRKGPNGNYIDDNYMAMPMDSHSSDSTDETVTLGYGYSYDFRIVAISDGNYALASGAQTVVQEDDVGSLAAPSVTHHEAEEESGARERYTVGDVPGAVNYELQARSNDMAMYYSWWGFAFDDGRSIILKTHPQFAGMSFSFRVRAIGVDNRFSVWSTFDATFTGGTPSAPVGGVTRTFEPTGGDKVTYTVPTGATVPGGAFSYYLYQMNADGFGLAPGGISAYGNGGPLYPTPTSQNITNYYLQTNPGADGTSSTAPSKVATTNKSAAFIAQPDAPSELLVGINAGDWTATFVDHADRATKTVIQAKLPDDVEWQDVGSADGDANSAVLDLLPFGTDWQAMEFQAIATTGGTTQPDQVATTYPTSKASNEAWVTPPTISADDSTIWNFGGEDAANYVEATGLHAQNVLWGSVCEWVLIDGTDTVTLKSPGSPSGDILSGQNLNDITAATIGHKSNSATIRLYVNGRLADHLTLEIRWPKAAIMVNHKPDGTVFPKNVAMSVGGYQTTYLWKVVDQLNTDVPRPLEINEVFVGTMKDIWPNNNWPKGPGSTGQVDTFALGTTSPWDIPCYFPDPFRVSDTNPDTVGPNDENAGKPVQEMVQEYYAGSKTANHGLRISRHVVRWYLGYTTLTPIP